MKLDDDSVRIELLSSRHDRKAFTCGNNGLDRYLREQATQDIRRRVASVFVAVETARPERICGFFTLSAASVLPAELPEDVAKRLPRLPVPAALIGRLAVDHRFQRRDLGSILLADAVKKAATAAETVATAAIVVDPIDETARIFYAAFGFVALNSPQPRMFLMLPRGAPTV